MIGLRFAPLPAILGVACVAWLALTPEPAAARDTASGAKTAGTERAKPVRQASKPASDRTVRQAQEENLDKRLGEIRILQEQILQSQERMAKEQAPQPDTRPVASSAPAPYSYP